MYLNKYLSRYIRDAMNMNITFTMYLNKYLSRYIRDVMNLDI